VCVAGLGLGLVTAGLDYNAVSITGNDAGKTASAGPWPRTRSGLPRSTGLESVRHQVTRVASVRP